MTPTIQLDQVRKSFGPLAAVSDLSLAIPPGSIYGLLGPNGAGKTTTIRMIMGIIAPDAGRVLFFGRPRGREDLASVGYLPEERGLYRKMTVRDHLVFLGELHGMRARDARPASDRWLERVGLAQWSRKKVEELSKGMQQKVQLAGTVLHEPEILVLDEPFSGLDPINQGLFKELLAEYRQRGRTVVFSTHIMEQAEKLCDQICLISGGRAVLRGTLPEIKRSFGGRTYRLVADGAAERIAGVPGIEQALPRSDAIHLVLAPDADAAEVLRRLVDRVAVREFRGEEPTLEEVFIQAVRDAH